MDLRDRFDVYDDPFLRSTELRCLSCGWEGCESELEGVGEYVGGDPNYMEELKGCPACGSRAMEWI